MTVPSTMQATPQATITIAEGETTDKASEFWVRVTGNVFKVYGQVPYALAQDILQSSDPDTAIRTRLVGYPIRVAAV